jgi:hypothetical protein
VLGADADTGVPKPGKDEVAPLNKGLGGATPATSFFSDGCSTDEGARLNGSEVVVVGCVDDVNVGRVDGVGPNLNGARDGPRVSKVCAGPVSDLLTAADSSTA